MKKILDNETTIKIVLPLTEEFNGLMITIANSFAMHGGRAKEYIKDETIETLTIETNEVTYYLMKEYLKQLWNCVEIEGNGMKVLSFVSSESE